MDPQLQAVCFFAGVLCFMGAVLSSRPAQHPFSRPLAWVAVGLAFVTVPPMWTAFVAGW